MNHPVGNKGPIPASILHIEGDPTSWGLSVVGATDPGWGDSPVKVEIIAPVAGTLVLSPARVGSFALVPPPPGDGWMPALTLVAPHLYIPTATGLTAAAPGYVLAPPDDNPVTLTDKLVTAMSGTGSTATVQISAVGGGVVVLNGAQLPFAVVAPAS
jgi:hypothetical protein